MVGAHRSRTRGFSAEFEEHREYFPGDDLRYVDWKVYGRHERHFIKQFREETNLRCRLVLDCSASMDYGPGGETKFGYACRLAAALAHVVLRQQDAVGLCMLAGGKAREVPPRTGRRKGAAIVDALSAARPVERGALGNLLQSLAEQERPPGLDIVISDLLGDPQEVCSGLKHLSRRRSEVLVLQILDPTEIEFPFAEFSRFEDLEEDLRVDTDPQTVRQAYREQIQGLLETYRRACTASEIDYALFTTDTSLEGGLMEFLSRRARAVANLGGGGAE
jgi:uncharacterized protein (DUF58 family)